MSRSLSIKCQTKDLVPERIIEHNITVSGLHLGFLFDSNPNKIHYIMNELFKMLENNKIKPSIYQVIPFDDVSISDIITLNKFINFISLIYVNYLYKFNCIDLIYFLRLLKLIEY